MTIRGWCPSVHEPMPSGDGLLVRVKPRGGRLDAAEMRLIAQHASAHGNGLIEITGRGNLQVRGLSPDGAASFAAATVAAGLASDDPVAERRRNVIATPLAGLDPAVHAATPAITAALETASSQAVLPAKFCFLVDGGGLLPPTAPADIRLHLRADQVEIVHDRETATVALADAVTVALSLSLKERTVAPKPSPETSRPGIGAIGGLAFGAGLPFGSAAAATWSALADLADRYGDGTIRLTPWRAVLFAGVAPALAPALADLGLITDPADPRLRVVACPGAPACASATVATRALAAELRPPPGAILHVSGCDKGCAHSGPASLTLVGRDGRFDLVRHGRAGDPPTRRALSPADVRAL